MEGYRAQSRLMYRGIGLFFALLLAIYFVYQIQEIVLVFLLTLLFAIVLSGPVNYLARLGLPRGLGVLVMLGGLLLAFWLASVAVTPVIQNQAGQFVRDLPKLLSRVRALTANTRSAFGLQQADASVDPGRLLEMGQNLLKGFTPSTALEVGRSIVSTVSLGVVALIVTIYLTVQPARLVNGFVSLFPAGQRERVREVLGKMYHAVQRWFLGQLSAMVIIGVLTALALSVIGIPYALLIGAFSGLLAFIPLVGVLLSVIPPVILALATNPVLAVWVVLAYIAIHQVEAHVIQPIVMSRAVALHPVVVVFAILIMGTFFKLVGLLLAVPLVAALSVLVHELWIARMDRTGVDPRPPEQKAAPGRGALLGRVSGAFRRSS